MQLDNYDLAILTALQQNARISNLELAETIGLSPRPLHAELNYWNKPVSLNAAPL